MVVVVWDNLQHGTDDKRFGWIVNLKIVVWRHKQFDNQFVTSAVVLRPPKLL